MSKYEPLNQYLYAIEETRLRLSFAEIEKILERPLPESARKHAAWWANNPTGHSHCQAWYEAGWRTENLNLADQTVDFVRQIDTAPAPLSASPWGALAATVTVLDPDALTSPLDEDWHAAQGRL